MLSTGSDSAYPAGKPAHLYRGGAARCGAVAELAVSVLPPTLDPAALGQGAGVRSPSSDGAHPAGQAAHVDRGISFHVGAVAQLAVIVISPALDPAGAGPGAGVSSPGGDGSHPAVQPADVIRGVSTIFRGAVAELAIIVDAPALDPAGICQRAGVTSPGGDGSHPAGEPAYVIRGISVRIGPITELASSITTPALDPARLGQSAGVISSDGDGSCLIADGKELGCCRSCQG